MSLVFALKVDNRLSVYEMEAIEVQELVNDIRLYLKDIEYISDYLENKIPINLVPNKKGFLIIDLDNNLILDNQLSIGIFKISPGEILASLDGQIIGESTNNNTFKRFVDAIQSNRLLGFEEWNDNGTKLNREIVKLDLTTESKIKDLVNSVKYGQFIFDTVPFRILSYDKSSKTDQLQFLKMLKKLDINKPELLAWERYIETMKEDNYDC